MENSNESKNNIIQLTEKDYVNLFAWISLLENRVEVLEKELGILNNTPRPKTLSKVRIYEETAKSEVNA